MHWRGGLLIAFTLLLVACGGNTYAPVSERSAPGQSQPSPREYIVRKGDTLYAIAFKYGLDYRQLANRNGIGSDYSIYPGQRLQLKAGATAKSSGSIVRDASIVAPKPIITSSRNNSPKSSSHTTKSAPVKKTAPATHTSTANKVVATKTEPSASKARTSEKSKPVESTGPIRWQWPASGKLIGTFRTSGTVNKGINIAGQKGDSIQAAAKGRVVYAGNGLLGYGNLVIVDHNQQFLSAYAHNSRVLVKENDMVEAGQKIAEMGSSGADRVMLHFEIRRDGQPVNPLKFLPRR